MKLSKKTIQKGQLVIVIEGEYKLPTMKNSPWYKPETILKAYSDIGNISSNIIEIASGETLEVIDLILSPIRSVKYKRLLDNEIYSSYLGEFIAFARLPSH